jgi:eukaryotic-like serine/threonine-protein kinase
MRRRRIADTLPRSGYRPAGPGYPLVVPTADVRIQLPDRYRVVRHVANGGMASVWSAEDSILGRLVAVKVLAQHVAADPSARTRFEREARTAARVSDHPNVVTIYDVGEHGGTPFIVMELLTGGSVADRLRGGRTVPRSRALAWLQQAAAALDYAHSEGIVHRDVKPANLLLDERERLAVGDFGIARAADDSNLTQVGQVLGTAAYLSPEQAVGKPATAASDRYSLAVVAFELLTGRRPFRGDHVAAQARQHVEGEVPASGLGPEVDAVLGRALAKDADERFLTAARFVDELGAVASRTAPRDEPTEATRKAPAAAAVVAPPRRREPEPAPPPRDPGTPTPPPVAPRRTGRSRGAAWKALAALGALVAAIVVVALVAGGGGGGDEQRAEQPAATQERQQTQERRQTQEQQQEEPQQTAPQETQPAEETPAPAQSQPPDNEAESGAGPQSEGNESPSQLDARGYQLLQNGQAQQAIPILQRAVAGFEAQGGAADNIGYGYALYNLGTAYLETGQPAKAIPLFEKRLEVSPDDRPEVVRKSLKQAQKAAGKD